MAKYAAVPKAVSDCYGSGTTEVPDNMVWVCRACGRTSRTRYGFNENRERVCDRGYDESCMVNSVLCYKPGKGPGE
jgi:hypothetical protein